MLYIHKKFLTKFYLIQVLFISSLSLSSCLGFDQSYLNARLVELRQLVQDETGQSLLEKVKDSTWRNSLVELDPGAAYTISRKLINLKAFGPARLVLEAQLASKLPEWQGLAFRDWLSLSAQEDPRIIINQSNDYFSSIEKTDSFYIEAKEAYYKTLTKTQLSLKQDDSVQEIIDRALQDLRLSSEEQNGPARKVQLGVDGVPGWLISAKAQLSFIKNQANKYQNAAYFALAYDAQNDHKAILALISQPETFNSDHIHSAQHELLLKLYELKNLLVDQKHLQAWELSKLILAQKPEFINFLKWVVSQAFGDEKKLSSSVLKPEGLLRDFYQSARLSGRFSEGIDFFKDLRENLWQANLLSESAYKALDGDLMLAYLLELQGRLERFRNDHWAAAGTFEQALIVSNQLEKTNAINPSDRRRQQWYFLRSVIDPSQEAGTVLFDIQKIIPVLQTIDDFEYFSDIYERILASLGQRREWQDLFQLYQACSTFMDDFIRFRYQMVLIRAQKLERSPAAENKTFTAKGLSELYQQRRSLYYYALAAHELGKPLDILNFIEENPGRILDESQVMDASAYGLEAILKSFLKLGMYQDASNFAWEHRRLLAARFQLDLSHQLNAHGLYRDAIRLADSLRLRFGLPVRKENLTIFYPRPFIQEFETALIESPLPWWLFTSLVRTESAFDARARSGPGAQGLAQLMPATALELAQRLRIDKAELSLSVNNLRMGARYLREQSLRFSDWAMALAAYNAGRGRVSSWRTSSFNEDTLIFIEIMPFEETRNYVRRVFENSLVYAWLYDSQDGETTLRQLLTKGNP